MQCGHWEGLAENPQYVHCRAAQGLHWGDTNQLVSRPSPTRAAAGRQAIQSHLRGGMTLKGAPAGARGCVGVRG